MTLFARPAPDDPLFPPSSRSSSAGPPTMPRSSCCVRHTEPVGWAASRRATPVDADVRLPGSKSLTNRRLVLAALADGPDALRAPAAARDTELMAAALSALGAASTATGDDWLVTRRAARRRRGRQRAGRHGDAVRPAAGRAGRRDAPSTATPYARDRPMATCSTGCGRPAREIDDGGRGRLPFTVHGTGRRCPAARCGSTRRRRRSSSPALLLAGAAVRQGRRGRAHRAAVPSLPHIEMTVEVLREAGVGVDDADAGHVAGRARRESPAPSTPSSPTCPTPRRSSPRPLVTGGAVTVPGWPAAHDPGRRRAARPAGRDGRRVDAGRRGLTVTRHRRDRRAGRRPARGQRADAGAGRAGARWPTAVADHAGSAHIRGHETDRLAALAPSSPRSAARSTETADGLHIEPGPLHGGAWHAYADHRMATAGAVLGLRGRRRRGRRHRLHEQDAARLPRAVERLLARTETG